MASRKPIKIDITVEIAAAGKALVPAVKRLGKALLTLDPATVPIGALSDLLYDLRQIRALPATLSNPFNDQLDPVIKAVEEHFVQSLKVGESSGVQGQYSRTQITESIVPVVEDKDKFYAHVAKTKNWDLLPSGVARKAAQERFDDKKRIPGIDKFHAKKVSCTKLSKAKAVK